MLLLKSFILLTRNDSNFVSYYCDTILIMPLFLLQVALFLAILHWCFCRLWEYYYPWRNITSGTILRFSSPCQYVSRWTCFLWLLWRYRCLYWLLCQLYWGNHCEFISYKYTLDISCQKPLQIFMKFMMKYIHLLYS